ncbi:MAG: DUF3352 domain-containing protein [Candidatus Omnitrophica bacterium]|nr:DUF3352 domain-containing protein [Candidatus Omnitrophota bacterium]
MTRTTKIILSVLVAVVVTALAGVLFRRGQPLAFKEVLPQGPLAYVQFSHVKEKGQAVRATDFWQDLRQADFTILRENSSLPPAQKDFLKSLTGKLFDPVLMTVLDEFFGKEFAVAVYPPQTSFSSGGGANDQELNVLAAGIPENIYLVTRPRANAEFLEFLSLWWGEYARDFKTERIPLGDLMLYRVTLPESGVQIGFVRIRDVVVVGLGDNAPRHSAAVYGGEEPPLASDGHYRKSQARALKSSDVNGYVDLEKLILLAKKFSDAVVQREESKKQLSGRFDALRGLESFGISGKWEDIPRMKFDLYVNPDLLAAARAAEMRCPPVKNETLSFVPSDAVGYQWSNCLDFREAWARLKEEVLRSQQRSGRTTSTIDDLEGALGVKIEGDVLPVLGDEMGAYLQDIRTANSSFPVPELAFFVEIADQPGAGRLVAKLDERFAANLKREDYNGVSIAYFVPVPGVTVEPAYCVLGRYFLVAFDRASIKDAVDTLQGRSPSLAASDVFQKVAAPAGNAGHFVQVVRVDQLARKLEEVLDWFDTRLAADAAKKEAFQAGSAKRLAEVVQEIQTKQSELEEVRKQLPALEDTIRGMESRQADAASQHTRLDQLKARAATLGDEIAASRARRAEIENTTRGYERRTQDREKRKKIEENIVKPLLKSFGQIRAAGWQGKWDKDVLESTFTAEVN